MQTQRRGLSITTTRQVGKISDFLDELGAFSPTISVSMRSYSADPNSTPDVAIIIPVHNQEDHVLKCLAGVTANVALNAEIVIIADGCSDRTPQVLIDWMQSKVARQSFTKITVAVTSESIYETLCDTLGFAISGAPYVIEVQADMTIREPGFDALLKDALDSHPTIVAVSGRGAHSWAFAGLQRRRGLVDWSRALITKLLALRPAPKAYAPSRFEFAMGEAIGRLGKNSETPLARSARRLFLHESVMRGPLAFNRRLFDTVGGFDCANFFLGNDDHDFALRAWVNHSLRVGYLPIDFDSPLHIGSTRRKRTPEEELEFNRLKDYYSRQFPQSALGRSARKTMSPPRVSLTQRPSSLASWQE